MNAMTDYRTQQAVAEALYSGDLALIEELLLSRFPRLGLGASDDALKLYSMWADQQKTTTPEGAVLWVVARSDRPCDPLVGDVVTLTNSRARPKWNVPPSTWRGKPPEAGATGKVHYTERKPGAGRSKSLMVWVQVPGGGSFRTSASNLSVDYSERLRLVKARAAEIESLWERSCRAVADHPGAFERGTPPTLEEWIFRVFHRAHVESFEVQSTIRVGSTLLTYRNRDRFGWTSSSLDRVEFWVNGLNEITSVDFIVPHPMPKRRSVV